MRGDDRIGEFALDFKRERESTMSRSLINTFMALGESPETLSESELWSNVMGELNNILYKIDKSIFESLSQKGESLPLMISLYQGIKTATSFEDFKAQTGKTELEDQIRRELIMSAGAQAALEAYYAGREQK